MDTRRLRNLLQELDRRLANLQKLAAGSGTTQPPEMLRKIFHLRAEAQRYIGKTDTLRLNNVAQLEDLISGLRATIIPDEGALPLQPSDIDGLGNLTSGLRIGLSQLGPKDILETAPGQKTAAFEFGYDNEMLVVAYQPLRPTASEIALAALETAIENGDYVS